MDSQDLHAVGSQLENCTLYEPSPRRISSRKGSDMSTYSDISLDEPFGLERYLQNERIEWRSIEWWASETFEPLEQQDSTPDVSPKRADSPTLGFSTWSFPSTARPVSPEPLSPLDTFFSTDDISPSAIDPECYFDDSDSSVEEEDEEEASWNIIKRPNSDLSPISEPPTPTRDEERGRTFSVSTFYSLSTVESSMVDAECGASVDGEKAIRDAIMSLADGDVAEMHRNAMYDQTMAWMDWGSEYPVHSF